MSRKFTRKKREEILSLEQANREFFARMHRLDQEAGQPVGNEEPKRDRNRRKRHGLHR